MGKAIAKGLFYLFAFIVVAWMVTNTKGMLDMVFPGNAIIPWLGLAVFDVGAVAWLVVFLRDASGTGQRSVSIVSSLVSLINTQTWELSKEIFNVQKPSGIFLLKE